MTDLATLGLAIDSSPASRAASDLDRLTASAVKVERAVNETGNAADRAGKKMAGASSATKQMEAAINSTVHANDNAVGAINRHVAAINKLTEAERRLSSSFGRGQDIAAYGAELDRLRGKFNPLFATIQQYKTAQAEIRQAHSVGAISAGEMTAAIRRERQATLASIATLKGRSAALRSVAASTKLAEDASGASRFNTSNLAAQGFDVASTAGFMPWWTVMLQQGPQAAQVFNDIRSSGQKIGPAVSSAFMQLINPISLVTMGVVALAAVSIQWLFSAKDDTDKLTDALENHAQTVGHLTKLYGEAAAAAENLASAGGDAFSFASIRSDAETLRNVLKMQQQVMAQSLSGDGWLSNMLGGTGASLDMLRNLTGDQIKFKAAVDSFLESVRRGDGDLDSFRQNVETIFSTLLNTSENPTELRATADAVLAIGESATTVSGKFAPFSDAINKLMLEFSEGKNGVVEFNREVSRIGAQDPSLQKIADEAIVLGQNINKVTEALKEMERARFRATEQVRDRLASERNDTGQSYYQERERQWELENRILDAQTKQVQALTDQEKIAAAAEMARARNPVNGEEQRREIAVAERQERERLDQQAREAATARVRERQEAIVGAQEELSLVGATIAQAARLRFEYAETAKLREEAAQTGRAASSEEIAAIQATAAAVGELAEKLAVADKQRDLLFDREQLDRNPIEQRVASEMRNLYGDEYKSHMDDAIADQIRLNDQWRTAQDELQEIGDIGEDALGGLLDILYESGDATEQLMKLFAGIGKQFAQMGLDRMLGNMKTGKSLFELPTMAGSAGAGGVAQSRSNAVAIGREIGIAVAPPIRDSFASVGGDLAGNIRAAADVLGVSARDLATVISYETGGTFSTSIRGGAGNRHIGLIQFGPAEQQKYGAAIGQTLSDQMQAVVSYMQDRGLKPGMGLMDMYSTVNAGRPGLYNRSDAGNGGAWGTVADKVNYQMSGHQANADRLLQKQAVSDGVIAANRKLQQDAQVQQGTAQGGNAQMSKLGAALGVGGAAFGAFAGGMQSGSPFMGGISGAMSGFGAAPALSALGMGSAAGPIGIIGGAVLGILGGIFGKSRQKRKEKEQARAELESQRGAIESLVDTAMGTPTGEFESQWRQMSDEIAKARKLASKAGDSALVKELDLASETFFDFLVDDWKRGLGGVIEAMESGQGMDGAFVKAQKGVKDLQDSLLGFVEDAKFFAENGGDYEKAKLTKTADDNSTTGSVFRTTNDDPKRYFDPISDAYRVAVERYKDELKKLDVNAILTTGVGKETREIQAFDTVDALMKKMTDLGVVFDALGNVLTADQVKERLEREKELQRSVEDAQKAAQKMALRQLTGAKEFTQIEIAIQTIEGTAAGLQTTLEKLGMTTDEATKAIEDGLAKAMDNLRKDYLKGLNGSINELSGKGYLNDLRDAKDLYKERLKDADALGISSSLAMKEFALNLSAIASESELSAEELEKYAKKLGVPFEVITDALKDLEKVNTKKWRSTFQDLNTRLMQASVNTETLAGQLKLFDRQARLERERLIEAGATARILAKLEETLYAERRKVVEDFYKQEISTAKSAVEEALDALRAFAEGIRDFRDTIKLDGNLSTLSPTDKLSEARRQYETTLSAANRGDRDAMTKLTSVSQTYLEQAKEYYASSEAYAAIFNSVDAALARAGTQAQGQITAAEKQIDLLSRQISSLDTVNKSVLTVADAMRKLNDTVSDYFKAGGRGFSAGGYTGDLGVNRVAGVVHGREFVANAATTARFRPQLEAMQAGNYRPASSPAPANNNSQELREIARTVAAAGNAQVAAFREEMEGLRAEVAGLRRETQIAADKKLRATGGGR